MRKSGTGSRCVSVCASIGNEQTLAWLSQRVTAGCEQDVAISFLGEKFASDELLWPDYDLFMTDLHPGEKQSGLYLLAQVRALRPSLRSLVVAQWPSREEVIAAFRAGAHGVFEMQIEPSPILKAIRCVHEGQVWASSLHLNYIVDELAAPRKYMSSGVGSRATINELLAKLSAREWEVAYLVVEGRSNKEIASALDVSDHTVRNHLVRIFAKLRVSSRTEVIYQIMSASGV